jgi:hypothetical protein
VCTSWTDKSYTILFILISLCVMKRKPELVLIWSGSEFFVKMTITQSLRSLKNWSQDQIESSIRKRKEKNKSGSKVPFESKKLTTLVFLAHPRVESVRTSLLFFYEFWAPHSSLPPLPFPPPSAQIIRPLLVLTSILSTSHASFFWSHFNFAAKILTQWILLQNYLWQCDQPIFVNAKSSC